MLTMKRNINFTGFYLILFCFIGLRYGSANDKTFVKITESDNSYELASVYNPAKSKPITAYLDKCLTGPRDLSFKNAQLDANITLDSKITFYIRSRPGELILKFDKRKNNNGDYIKFKKMCEGIKAIIGEK